MPTGDFRCSICGGWLANLGNDHTLNCMAAQSKQSLTGFKIAVEKMAETVEVKTAVTFRRFGVPNYAIIETFSTSEPSRENAAIPIKKLDEAAITALAEAWIEDLYAKTDFRSPFQLPATV